MQADQQGQKNVIHEICAWMKPLCGANKNEYEISTKTDTLDSLKSSESKLIGNVGFFEGNAWCNKTTQFDLKHYIPSNYKH